MRNGHQLFTFFLLLIYSSWSQNGIISKVDFDLNNQNIEIQSILMDEEGFLFLGTNNGLYHFDGIQSKHILSYENQDFQLDEFIRLTTISREEILLGTKRGLYVFNIRNYELKKILLVDQKEPEFVLISKIIEGWVYVFNTEKQAFKLNIKTGEKTPIVLDEILLKDEVHICMLRENNNEIEVIGKIKDTDKLFNSYNITTGEKKENISIFPKNTILNKIILWPKRYRLTEFFEFNLKENLFLENDLPIEEKKKNTKPSFYTTMDDVLKDEMGFYWMATKDGLFQYIPKNPEISSLSNGKIRGLAKSPDGTLAIASERFVLLKSLDKETKITRIKKMRRPYGLYFKSKDTLYVGTEYSGLYQIIDENLQKAPKYFDFLDGYMITKIFKDTSGLIWFVCQNKGVFVFNPKTKAHKLKENINCQDLIETKPSEFTMAGKGFIETFRFKDNNFTNSIKFKNDYTIRSIKTHKSVLYFTTLYHGVKKLDPSLGKIEKVGEDLGLGDLTCYSLNIVNSTLFVGTNNGLILYDMKNNTSNRILKNEGLSDREFNSYSDFFDETTKQLYLGTQNGVTKLNTANPFISKNQFDVFLRKITFVNSSGEKKEILAPKLDQIIEFPPQSYQIVFELASNDLRSPDKTNYIYAFDSETPIKSENSNSLMFPYLPEDYYTLSIKAENERKQKSQNTLKINFRVKPVFYQSSWFISLIILILSFSISLILYYQNQVKIRLVEAKTQFASDLHDEMGGDLTAIKFKTELLALKASDDQKRELLSIKNITESTMVNVSDLIWTLKASNQTLGAMVERINKLLKLRFSAGKYKYKIKTSDLNKSAILRPKVKENLYLILKETLSNFIKYSTYDTFNIVIANSGKGVVMKIFQDGQPIDKNQDTVGYGAFGIPIMKDRARKAGFNLKIDKTKNWTTTIIIDKL